MITSGAFTGSLRYNESFKYTVLLSDSAATSSADRSARLCDNIQSIWGGQHAYAIFNRHTIRPNARVQYTELSTFFQADTAKTCNMKPATPFLYCALCVGTSVLMMKSFRFSDFGLPPVPTYPLYISKYTQQCDPKNATCVEILRALIMDDLMPFSFKISNDYQLMYQGKPTLKKQSFQASATDKQQTPSNDCFDKFKAIIYPDYIYIQGEPGKMEKCGEIYKIYDDINMTFNVIQNEDKTGFQFSYYRKLDKIEYGKQLRLKLYCSETEEEDACNKLYPELLKTKQNATVMFSMVLFQYEQFIYKLQYYPTLMQNTYENVEIRIFNSKVCVDLNGHADGLMDIVLEHGSLTIKFQANMDAQISRYCTLLNREQRKAVVLAMRESHEFVLSLGEQILHNSKTYIMLDGESQFEAWSVLLATAVLGVLVATCTMSSKK